MLPERLFILLGADERLPAARNTAIPLMFGNRLGTRLRDFLDEGGGGWPELSRRRS